MTRNWYAMTPKVSTALLADTHSLSMQRGYAILCLAYGKDPDTFKDLAQAWLPPASRIARENTVRRKTPSARPSCRMSIRF